MRFAQWIFRSLPWFPLILWSCEQPRRFSDDFIALRGQQDIPSGVKAPPPRLPAGVTIVDKSLGNTSPVSTPPTPRALPALDDAPPYPDAAASIPAQLGPGALRANLDFAVIGPARIAQTFQAPEAGLLKKIAWRVQVNHTKTASGTLWLYPTDTDNLPSGSPLAQARVSFTANGTKPKPWSEHTWLPPVPLQGERLYAWVLQPDEDYSLNVAAGDDRMYLAGRGWVDSGRAKAWNAANVDFAFQTYYVTDSLPPGSLRLNVASKAAMSLGTGATNSIQ